VLRTEVSDLAGEFEALLTRPSLAYAEMYLTLATIVRRFDMELFETTREDVTMVHDFFVAAPRLDSKGIRIKVTALN
jgi:hypothetical protein